MLSEIHDQDNYKSVTKNKSYGLLKGIPSSSGIVLGKALVIDLEPQLSESEIIPIDLRDSEISRYKRAIETLNNDYDEIISNSKYSTSTILNIIETYKLLINDIIISENIIKSIKKGNSAENAVFKEYEGQKKLFRNTKDQILKERIVDLDNVKRRVISALSHFVPDYEAARGKILVAQTLSPSDLVKYKECGALGIITEMGGIASHISILSRSFEFPAIIGVKEATKIISNELFIIIDGFTGLIIYNPDNQILQAYDKKVKEIEKHKKSLGRLVSIATETIDKHKIRLLANIDRVEDVKSALISGAEGVGLVRSESLLANSARIPGEDTQFNWYKEIAERMYPLDVTIRCFDLGSDKFSTGLPVNENNPALGLRGIRYLLYNMEVFKSQLKAILKASINKNVRIILPMISDINEIILSKKILIDCMLELDKQKLPYDSNIKMGIVIETPAAVFISEALAKECDYFSIGTNDLTQYTLAADRTNDLVTENYDSFHPAVLKMIDIITSSAKKAGIPVGICGELAGHAAATQILIGLGIDEFSVPPSLLLELKNRILKINYKEAVMLKEKLLKVNNSNDILKVLESDNIELEN